MTAPRALLARINSRLDEIEAGPAVAAVAVFLAVSIAGLIFGGQNVLNVVLIVSGAVLAWNGGLLHSRADEALDNADKAHGRVQAVEDHLTGNEAPGVGRHSRRAA
jgi:hypothetical protein